MFDRPFQRGSQYSTRLKSFKSGPGVHEVTRCNLLSTDHDFSVFPTEEK